MRWLGVIAAGLVAAVVMLVAGIAFRAYETNQAEQRSAEADVRTCIQVERIKRQLREDAIENWKNLARNARLLRIELTQEVREVALQERNATLRRFAPIDCDHLPSTEELPQ
jgi:hypothetical protein